MNYQLTYPEYKDLPEAKITQVLYHSNGCYNARQRDTQKRLDKGRLSKGDLQRMGIVISPYDLKTILRYSPEFQVKPFFVFNGETLVFKKNGFYLSIYPQALGILPNKLKKDDLVSLCDLVDNGYKGKVPVLKEIKQSGYSENSQK